MDVQPNPFDVIENFFGDWPDRHVVHKLNEAKIEQLAEAALEMAEAYAETPAPEHTTYLGGWLGGNWHQQLFRGDLGLALLYYPRLLVHDPLAEFFFHDWNALPPTRDIRAVNGMSIHAGPDMWAGQGGYTDIGADLEATRARLAALFEYLGSLAPLVRSGAVVCRPQWPVILRRKTALSTSVRHDVKHEEMEAAVQAAAEAGDAVPTWDNVRGLNVLPNSPIVAADRRWIHQNEYFYLAKTLAIADAAGATYAPVSEGELGLLRAKASQLRVNPSTDALPQRVLEEVSRILIPDLQLSIAAAVQMRESEESFDDWRRALRLLALEARDDSPEELRQRVEDTLMPAVRSVQSSLSRSGSARKALRETGATALITTTASTAVAAALGGQADIAATAGATGGVLNWLWKMLRPPQLGGRDAVIASIVRSRPKAQK